MISLFKNKNKNTHRAQWDNASRGYTLLFAVLTATLVLGVAVFILGVSKKQYALAVAARDSTFALYSADSGLECAAAAQNSEVIDPDMGGPINCNGTTVTLPPFDPNNPILFAPPAAMNATAQSYVGVPLANDTCAVVVFTKGSIGADSATVIDSRGYNYCVNDPVNGYGPELSSSRTVERALRLTLIGI